MAFRNFLRAIFFIQSLVVVTLGAYAQAETNSSAQKLGSFNNAELGGNPGLEILRELGQKIPGRRCEEGHGLFGYDYESNLKRQSQTQTEYQGIEWNFPQSFISFAAQEYLKESEKKISCGKSLYSRQLAENLKDQSPAFFHSTREICESWNEYYKTQNSQTLSETEKQKIFWRARQHSFSLALEILQTRLAKSDSQLALSFSNEWLLNAKIEGFFLPQLNINSCGAMETAVIGSSAFDQGIAGLMRLTLVASESEEELSEEGVLADQLAEDIMKNKSWERQPASKE